MFEREDTTYNDLRKNSFESWLNELEQNEDVSVRGGVKLAREYVAHLKNEDGNEKELKVPEDFLAENKIEEGSVWKWR